MYKFLEHHIALVLLPAGFSEVAAAGGNPLILSAAKFDKGLFNFPICNQKSVFGTNLLRK